MSRLKRHDERHLAARIGWLRAAVLGANDGIVSTASLVIGVAAAGATRGDMVVAGAAGLVAGAMSMAAGEYVSVSSQADIERADLARERAELLADPAGERAELADIYVARGLRRQVAVATAEQLMAHDALGAHAREELNITDLTAARPVVAAMASAATFTAGALPPLMLVLVVPGSSLIAAQVFASLLFLAALGAIGACAGGAPVLKASARVVFWGGLAMALTAGIGRLVGLAV